MMLHKLSVTIFIVIGPIATFSQAVDNMASFRMMPGNNYVRLHYENDYFSMSDEYYTQGINLEMVSPSLQKFPLSKLLVAPRDGNHQFGLSLEHNAYTPTSIRRNDILYGDRPFAANFFLKSFAISNHPTAHYRITSSLSAGVIGPAAGAYGIQKTIHKWINGTEPHGWQNQIRNDLIINYELGAEKEVMHLSDGFLVTAFANARAGILSTKFSSGLIMMAGKIDETITSVFIHPRASLTEKTFRFHVYLQNTINLIGYDATLQGGLFTSTPYQLSSDEISRFTLQSNGGLVLYFHSLYMEYFQTISSKEFKTGHAHQYGGVRIGVKY